MVFAKCMENLPPQFIAAGVSTGAVSQDGNTITIEFEGDGALLWVSLPAALLPRLQFVTRELDALAVDVRNGLAEQRYVSAEKDTLCDGPTGQT
jgi:hypothetical protein